MAEIKLISPPSVEYLPIPEGQIPGIDGQQIDPLTSIEGWADLLKPPAEEESFEVPANEFKKKYTAGEGISETYASILWEDKAYIAKGQGVQSITGGATTVYESFDKDSKRVIETTISGTTLRCRIGELNSTETAFDYGDTSAPIIVQQTTAAACIDNENNTVFVFYGLIDDFNGNLEFWCQTGTIDSSNNITWNTNAFQIKETNQSGFTINDAIFVPENNTVFVTYKLFNAGFLTSLKIIGSTINFVSATVTTTLSSFYGLGFDTKNNKVFVHLFSYNTQNIVFRAYTVNTTGNVLTSVYHLSVSDCTGQTAATFNPKDGYIYFRYRYNRNVDARWSVFKIFSLAGAGSVIATANDVDSYLQDSNTMFVDQISDKVLFASNISGVLAFKIRNSIVEFVQDSAQNYSGYRKFEFEGRNLLLNSNTYLKYKAESREKAAGVIQTGGSKGDLISLILLGGENTKFTGLTVGSFLYIQTSGIVTELESDYVIGIAITTTTALINKSV